MPINLPAANASVEVPMMHLDRRRDDAADVLTRDHFKLRTTFGAKRIPPDQREVPTGGSESDFSDPGAIASSPEKDNLKALRIRDGCKGPVRGKDPSIFFPRCHDYPRITSFLVIGGVEPECPKFSCQRSEHGVGDEPGSGRP